MAKPFPYTLYSCPCTDISTRPDAFNLQTDPERQDEEGESEQTLNPHSPRANYALYPLEHLLFCNECHQLRCQRCFFEEVLYYYCPNCLFETQSNVVKTETNRCTRSCFQCPICFASLGVSPFSKQAESDADGSTAKDGPFILSCPHCSWTSYENGITFDKALNISGQLAKLLSKRDSFQQTLDPSDRGPASEGDGEDLFTASKPQQRSQFSNLATFYKNQIEETTPTGPLSFGQSLGLDSPGQLSRLLTAYGVGGIRKQKGKLPIMREALAKSEGLSLHDPSADAAIITRLRAIGLSGTPTVSQRARQPTTIPPRFAPDLLPIPTQLRAKRAKRCRTCRHNLVKPEEKRHTSRYRIKLVAINQIPLLTARPLDPAAVALAALPPGKPVQLALTLCNPLFDAVQVTLAAPARTPGPAPSAVTILCPEFEVGANADVWDEALEGVAGRVVAVEGQQPEAGKVWERGRNWTSVVMEVVPGPVQREGGDEVRRESLEVPLFVKVDYETEDTTADLQGGEEAKRGERKVKRQMAFWCVLVVGRIAG